MAACVAEGLWVRREEGVPGELVGLCGLEGCGAECAIGECWEEEGAGRVVEFPTEEVEEGCVCILLKTTDCIESYYTHIRHGNGVPTIEARIHNGELSTLKATV